MLTRSIQLLRPAALAFLFGAVACASPDPGDAADARVQLQLTRRGPPGFDMPTQAVTLLRATVTDEQANRVAGVSLVWSFAQPPQSAAIEGATESNVDGIAEAKLVTDGAESFVVRASLPDGSAFVEWSVEVVAPVRHLRGAPSAQLVATDAPHNQRMEGDVAIGASVQLRVRLTEEAGELEVGLMNEKVKFQVIRGVSGTSLPGSGNSDFVEVSTDDMGTAAAELKVGDTTGPVTVLAIVDDLPPVQFDLQ